MSSQPPNVPTCRGFVLKKTQGPGPRFCCCKTAHVQKNNEVGMSFPSASDFSQAQARNMGYQQKAEKSTTIRDGHWRRRHLPIVIEIHLEVHHIPYQMQPIISLRLGPREKHTCSSIMNVIPSGCHIWANTHIYIHIYMCEIYTIMAPCKMAVNSFLYKPVAAPGAPWSHSTPHPRGQTDAPPSASVGPQWAPGSDRWMRQPT